MKFFTDHNAPDSVAAALIAAGHEVIRLRDAMPRDSEDQTVALACAASGYVLVTADLDFRAIARRLNMTQRDQRRLHCIQLRCSAPESAARLIETLPLIEFEWLRVEALSDAQLIVHVNHATVMLYR